MLCERGRMVLFFFLKFLVWWGETTQHTNWGHCIWWTSLVSSVKAPLAIHLLHVTSWFGSNKQWKKVDNLGNGVLAFFVAAVSGWVPRRRAAPAAVSSTAFKMRSHKKGWIPFFSKKLLDYYQLLDFTGEIVNCLTSLGELMPCGKLGCFCF